MGFQRSARSFFFPAITLIIFSTVSISDAAVSSAGSRSLLQAQSNCPVDFETMNYTIITSRCKAPGENVKTCCDGLRDFLCPYAEQINDPRTNCLSTVYSYIYAKGPYQPGYFYPCVDSVKGVSCPAMAPTAASGGALRGSTVVFLVWSGILSLLLLEKI